MRLKATSRPHTIDSILSSFVIARGCWIWVRSMDGNGYGKLALGGRKEKKAHRVVYELLRGPIPEGKQLDHLCRNKLCVNPAHLEPVTQKENILRGFGIGVINARKTSCVNGHPFTPDNTVMWGSGKGKPKSRHCRECNRIYLRVSRGYAL